VIKNIKLEGGAKEFKGLLGMGGYRWLYVANTKESLIKEEEFA